MSNVKYRYAVSSYAVRYAYAAMRVVIALSVCNIYMSVRACVYHLAGISRYNGRGLPQPSLRARRGWHHAHRQPDADARRAYQGAGECQNIALRYRRRTTLDGGLNRAIEQLRMKRPITGRYKAFAATNFTSIASYKQARGT